VADQLQVVGAAGQDQTAELRGADRGGDADGHAQHATVTLIAAEPVVVTRQAACTDPEGQR
jgi:hypothetical protein